METPDFVAYVGPSNIHDGVIQAIRKSQGSVEVEILDEKGGCVTVLFRGIHAIHQNRAIGMVLYSLSEMRSSGSERRFVFVNTDDESEAKLEVVADSVEFK